MSWDDCRRRREAIRSVLAFAELNPQRDIPFEAMPAVSAVFADRRQVLLALQYDWQQVLWAQLDLHSLDSTGSSRSVAEVRAKAWAAAVALRPTLRDVLDRYPDPCSDPRIMARQNGLLVAVGIGHHCSERRTAHPTRAA